MSALAVSVPFHDGSIPCLIDPHDPTPYVALRPVCEQLGLDYETHHKRLRQQPWAIVAMKAVDGKIAQVAVVDRVTFAMWLATIQTTRLRQADSRRKVELYQRDAARVLERHCFGDACGSKSSQSNGAPLTLPAAELIAELVERQVELERRVAELEAAPDGDRTRAALTGVGKPARGSESVCP